MWGDIILQKCTKNHDHSWETTCDGCNFYFSFWAIFSPLTTKKSKFLINENAWKYHHSTQVYQKLWSHDAQLLRYGAWQVDRQTDWQLHRWKKWHIEVGAPPKKQKNKKTLQKCFSPAYKVTNKILSKKHISMLFK